MDFAEYFPIWNKLTPEERELLLGSVVLRQVKKGTLLHGGAEDCQGLFLVASGQLRAYIVSEEGREITIYRLFERDLCLLSASCVMQNIQFEVTIEAEKDSSLFVVPARTYKAFQEQSAAVANYTSQLMAGRFSEVMWLLEQIMWKSFDRRLAEFLLNETLLEGSSSLKITHEAIGNHLGTAREVVTRMLRYFQSEQMVKLSRGVVEVTDSARLRKLCGE